MGSPERGSTDYSSGGKVDNFVNKVFNLSCHCINFCDMQTEHVTFWCACALTPNSRKMPMALDKDVSCGIIQVSSA